MNSTALKNLLTVCILTALSLCTTANAQNVKPIATFPGGIVYLPTINENNVIVRYTTPFVREATFYPRSDTLIAMRLDTCQRSYIALSWAFDALEQRHIDSLSANKKKIDEIKEKADRRVEQAEDKIEDSIARGHRRNRFRGFLCGALAGCAAMAWAVLR